MGKRAGEERIAACVVRADTRADVNNVVRRELDVRKCSFLAHDRAVEESGMQYGGITPIGLPADWRLLVDARVVDVELAVVGSGIRGSKLFLPGPGPRRSCPAPRSSTASPGRPPTPGRHTGCHSRGARLRHR